MQAFFSRCVVKFDKNLKRIAGIDDVFTRKTCMRRKKTVYYAYQTEFCGSTVPVCLL